jgi:hypothetical protein
MPHGLTTAPANPAPRWPSGYVEALREVGAQEKAIPFCIRWVRGFFAVHPGRRRRDLGRAEIEAFLRKVAARPNVTNWQVHPPSPRATARRAPPSPTSYGAARQAREALEVYYERFRGIALAPRPDGVVPATADKRPTSVRETPRSRPMAEQSTTVQHRSPSKPIPDAGNYAPVRPQVKPDLESPSRQPPRLGSEPIPLPGRPLSLGNRKASFRRSVSRPGRWPNARPRRESGRARWIGGRWRPRLSVAAGVKVPDFAGERVPRPFHSSFWDRKLLPSMVTVSQ